VGRTTEQEVLDLFGKAARPMLDEAALDGEACHLILFRTLNKGGEIQVATLGTFRTSDICEAMKRYINAQTKGNKRHGKADH
jgi:spore maturation protein SpmB